MKSTIFTAPLLSTILHYAANSVLYVTGWRVDGRLPDLPKFVLIGAPHTSNWDFVLFLGVIFHLRADVHFMGKAELFRWPFGWFFRWCGGIPVDRKKSQGLVEQMTRVCNESENFILTIAPEGTRYKTSEWKMGFYHIAKSSQIPIVMAIVDGDRKVVGIGQVFHPTENMQEDLKVIKAFFAGVTGINPRKKYITLQA